MRKLYQQESVTCPESLSFLKGHVSFCREGNGNALQYSCLENPMDREAWQATIHVVTKSQKRLSNKHTHTHNLKAENPVLFGELLRTIGWESDLLRKL